MFGELDRFLLGGGVTRAEVGADAMCLGELDRLFCGGWDGILEGVGVDPMRLGRLGWFC